MLSFPVLLLVLYQNTKTWKFWEYDSEQTVLAPLLRLEKPTLATLSFLTLIILLPIIGLLIWQNKRFRASIKRLTKDLKQNTEFFPSCGLQWKVMEFERHMPEIPFPYCNCHRLPMAQSGHSETIFECPMTQQSFTLKNEGKQIIHADALKIARKEIQKLLDSRS